MTALTLNHEFGLMRLRFQRTLVVSVVVHAVLFGALALLRDLAPTTRDIIEITWLDQPVSARVEETPAPLPTPAVAAVEPAVEPERIEPSLTVKEKLARAGRDDSSVRERLQQLDPSPLANRNEPLSARSPRLVDSARATMAPVVRSGAPANLNRGATADKPAVALTRGPTSSSRTAAVMAELPAAGVTGGGAEVAQPGAEASPAVRDLGGATLTGLVADRRVVHHVMPVYPDWATTQAVEAAVTLHFVVLPGGAVKSGVRVEKTAGFRDFDDNAVAAIEQWRFAPLVGGEAREQWGTITFRYRLND